ncbi:MAG: tetratricopeptide repeat protein [Campylobacter sputorum]|uniref:tetratricopeptide repeat protein n=1 Tax=Campylobacter sputorum TaxID=206 RepID=UPI000B799D30|nr:tetratricopeptide repeat protein [Campylobacter sputorum]ASM38847.1 tetratricopeptide repeat protein [Campylobacter sputorum bv. paraureolyticus LMG 11764]MDY6120500.1 tetratricopeptide repeat protein [Campylobacter sputorum]
MKKNIIFSILLSFIFIGCASTSKNLNDRNYKKNTADKSPLTQKQIEAQTYKLEILKTSCDNSQNPKVCEQVGDSANALGKYDIAIKYYDISCKQNFFSSCIKLANVYETATQPDIKDEIKALQIYDQTCKKGDKFSCTKAGDFFYKKDDIKTALEYFNYACGLYEMKSCFLMAEIFEKGKGEIPKDLEIAKNIYTTICFRGDSDGCKKMKELDK